MIKQNIINGFLETTHTKDKNSGKRVLDNDLVNPLDIKIDKSIVDVSANVISENLFSTYLSEFKINFKNYNVIDTNCTCADFERQRKHNYVCKHIYAILLKFLEDIYTNEELKKHSHLNKVKKVSSDNILNLLLNEDEKTKLKLEILLNKNKWSKKIKAEFKIGYESSKSNNLYSLKDINLFMLNKYNEIPVKYGKDFTFDIKRQEFRPMDIELLRFISMLQEIDLQSPNFRKSQDRLVSGKEISIPNYLLKIFFKTIKNHKVYLNDGFFSRKVECEIIEGDIPLPIDVYDSEDIIVEFVEGLPVELGENSFVYMFKSNIYIPTLKQIEGLNPYLNIDAPDNKIILNKEQKDIVYRRLIPKLNKLSEYLFLDKSVTENIIVTKPLFAFYLDRKNSDVSIKLNVIYKNYEFNIFKDIDEKYIYRDLKAEEEIINKIFNLGFELFEHLFVFRSTEDTLYKFLKYDIAEFQKLGEVFYSNNFKGLLMVNENFDIQVSCAREDYLELKFDVKNITNEEFRKIINSIINNNKYFKLKSGEFIDLEDIKLKELVSMIKLINRQANNENIFTVPNYFGYYIKDKLDNIQLKFNDNKKVLDSYKKDKVLDITDDIPGLNAKLRPYQKFGVSWLTEKYNLSLGGILGDEMGLGKTIQAIGLILNVKPKKTLIVAPTSLIYNWKDELTKFAPSLKVCILSGNKKNRVNLLSKCDEFDIILTTYNTLRLDIEEYLNYQFDLCLLDEAQNIKNPKSLNTKACKKIVAPVKFAITGTPLENNLLDLWSLFDFILPGYLFAKEKFNYKFNRNLNEDEVLSNELNRLITPFILRRLKSEVLKELPPKIEKVIKVDMSKEQSKIYFAYNKHVRESIEKELTLDDLNSNQIKILSYITKLRQISIDPSMIMNDYLGSSGKLEVLFELLNEILQNNKKVLIFSQFTSALKIISRQLEREDINFSYIDGKVPSKTRQELTKDFNKDPNNNIFLISLKAGGTGLNLSSATVVIHLDPWWNPAVENQATDRAHRIGQKEPVEVIKIISANTVEEKVLKLQELKKELIQNVLDNGDMSKSLISTLNPEEFMSLFSD